MLIGNVGKEPVVRYYDHDQAVATFSLATTPPQSAVIRCQTARRYPTGLIGITLFYTVDLQRL